MKLRVLAVGTRMPRWVREASDDYLTRLAARLPVSVKEIEPGPRASGRSAQQAIAVEGQRLLAALRAGELAVALDEHGVQMSTRELATWLAARMQAGQDIAFLIGGPDGLAEEVLARSSLRWSLSRLTFPHALVRVVLAEQLYRAHAVLSHHPYHRE